MTNIEMAKELREAMMLYTAVNGKEIGGKSKEIYEKCIQLLEAVDRGELISKQYTVDKIKNMMDYDGFRDGDCVSRRAVIGIINAI